MQRILLFIGLVCFPWRLNPNATHPTSSRPPRVSSRWTSGFIDSSILKELEDSGFVKRLYSN